MKLKISRKAFVKWLRDYPKLEFDRDDCCGCPIAVYLGGTCDRDVRVDCDAVTIDGRQYTPPKWVRDFVAVFDLSVGKPTARLALSLL